MNIINQKTGWIEVICGSMFSGKTEELIRRIRRAEYAKQRVLVFKPVIDDRYDANNSSRQLACQVPCRSLPLPAALTPS